MTFIAPRSGAVKHGGPKDDTPLGWSGPDSLFGGAGDDVLWGNHAIEDSTARDILFGGLGDDTVFCSPGSNVISGGPGDDVLNGGAGRSRVTGGPGNDTLNTRGAGPHTVDAGPGSDIICGRCAIEAIEVRIPAQARAAGGGDGHMTIVDQSSGWEYDLWRVQTKPSGGGRLAFAWGGRTRIDGDGLGSDATAARLGNLAGAIRAQELTAGRIDHALFMVVRYDSGGHVNPAMKSGRACADRAGAPPMGARFQLDMSTLQINALPVPVWKKTILHAMADYGSTSGTPAAAARVCSSNPAARSRRSGSRTRSWPSVVPRGFRSTTDGGASTSTTRRLGRRPADARSLHRSRGLLNAAFHVTAGFR